MLHSFRILFGIFLGLAPFSQSFGTLQIVKVKTQTDLKNYLKPGTWVFTDFDRLLMAKNGDTPYAYELNPAYTALLKKLQDKGIPVFGLTARGLDQADYTFHQLWSLDLDFTKSHRMTKTHDLGTEHFSVPNTAFKNGVLFAPSIKNPNKDTIKCKGTSLKELLEAFPNENRTVLIIDDQHKQLLALQRELDIDGTLIYCPFYGHLLFKSKSLPPYFPQSFKNLVEDKVVTMWDRDMMRLKDKNTGHTYLLQTHPSIDQMKEEILTLRIYEALGIPVPAYVILSGRGIEMTFKKFDQKGTNLFLLTDDFLRYKAKKPTTNLAQNLRNHYVVDAFLSHTGLVRNNTIMQLIEYTTGQIIRPAFFSTLRLGRTGKRKHRYADWSAHNVVELEWYKDSTRSLLGSEIYKSVTDTELKQQIMDLLAKKDIVFNTFIETEDILAMDKPEELELMFEKRFEGLEEAHRLL